MNDNEWNSFIDNLIQSTSPVMYRQFVHESPLTEAEMDEVAMSWLQFFTPRICFYW